MKEKRMVGHTFLSRLGKRRLRPGGIEATQWLYKHGNFSPGQKILEVACNMGTTMIEVAQRYGCEIIGVDIDRVALKQAEENIEKAGLTDQLTVQKGNAFQLPFEANHFDIVINEAMLTMLDDTAKFKALTEFYRVLKPGGKLLTHDICLYKESDLAELSRTLNMRVAPLTVKNWLEQYRQVGFRDVEHKTGEMSLMNPKGLVKDEGLTQTFKIVKNGLKPENRKQFVEMFHYFKKQQKSLYYIVNCAKK